MLAILDYGVGNLFSLQSSLRYVGAAAEITRDAAAIRRADKVILPGVGAFADAAQKLRASGLFALVQGEVAAGKPLLGICLGMQLLFQKSYEYGEHEGLALLPGNVCPIAPVIGAGLKVPHIGWNALRFPVKKQKSPLFAQVEEGECVYFVHSYAAMDCAGAVTATAEYGVPLTAAVGRDNVLGTQFHPEKSGDVGLRILRAFAAL
ncbi:MAG: imidazole glycerol phosphate synthase subunit HisH [Christensenellaceae bacterium]|jgi:glutamine amidotransferase|nr:imidazole glycerol phosphate synthase subunit HisH [Christensenellaceae bacterium]